MKPEHEDAYPAANRYAGEVTNLGKALSECSTTDEAKNTIAASQVVYTAIFNAFIAGVDWGRKNEVKP
jgi:hypothetical protein